MTVVGVMQGQIMREFHRELQSHAPVPHDFYHKQEKMRRASAKWENESNVRTESFGEIGNLKMMCGDT